MELIDIINRFYYQLTLKELRMMNHHQIHENITYNSLLYLDLIAYTPDCTAGYLAETLHVAPSAITSKVRELERLGLVTRTRSERDKRVYYLHINEQLRAEYRAYDQILYGALDELEARYTPQQVDLLCEMLDAINRGFQQAKTARALPGGKEKKGKET